MQSYVELTPPTAVTHSLSLPFLAANANNLIVIKTSLLQVFSLKAVTNHTVTNSGKDAPQSAGLNVPGSGVPSAGITQRVDRGQTTKLVFISQYELSGTVTSIARVKIKASRSGGGMAILLSFRDAKLSLIEWDPERYSISTISIHYYEQEDIQSSPWEPSLSQSVNYLTVDPRSRCAALKFGARHLAILPFDLEGDDLVMDDFDFDAEGANGEAETRRPEQTASQPLNLDKAPYAPSFVLSLMALDPSLAHPVHLAFLEGYREPTFGILSSHNAASSALLRERRDLLSYTVFTLDIEQRASTTLLSVNNLPYDLCYICPLALPVGGALLVGGNELIHIDQAGKANGVMVNESAKHCTSYGLLDQSSLGLKLEGCAVEKLGSETGEMLIILNDGGLALLSFRTDGRSVSGLCIRCFTDESNGLGSLKGAPSSTSVVGRGRLFIGSEDADAVIIGWARKADKLKRQRSRPDVSLEAIKDDSDLDEDFLEDDEDDLYASTKPSHGTKSLPNILESDSDEQGYILKIHDTLDNYGPINGIALYTTTVDDTSTNQDFMLATCRGQAGSISRFTRELVLHVSQRFELQDVQDIWSICASEAADYTNYLVANIRQGSETLSSLYKISANAIERVVDTQFDNGEIVDSCRSVDVGVMKTDLKGTQIVQVLSEELRVFDLGECLLLVPLIRTICPLLGMKNRIKCLEPFAGVVLL